MSAPAPHPAELLLELLRAAIVGSLIEACHDGDLRRAYTDLLILLGRLRDNAEAAHG